MTHGENSSYTWYRCRCDDCQAAHAAHQRKYRQIRKETGWRLLAGRWISTYGYRQLPSGRWVKT